ncbi:MAG TPA: rhodanese-like domain-containing protein [Gemmatimonadales bacterium]|jgi:thiosulfate/3-mercaptopyruvate sulfurtransferase
MSLIPFFLVAAGLLQHGGQPLVVDHAWTAARLADPSTVVLHVGPRDGYDAGHIPGARFLQVSEISAPPDSGALPLELPSPETLDSVLESKGISSGSQIILYWADEWVTPTTRAVFTLTWAGLGGQVSVLDGGLAGWKAAGHDLSTDVPTAVRGDLVLHPDPTVVVDALWVRDRLGQDAVAILDARLRRFYDGDSGNGRIPRPGHIAGAASLPFDQVLTESEYFKPREELRQLFRNAGAADGDVVVTYCHIGQQASALWFAARLLGYDAKLYDGSYTDWAARDSLPVAIPDPR